MMTETQKPLYVEFPSRAVVSYPIWIDSNLLDKCSLWMPRHASTVVVLTDHWVKKQYAGLLEQSLRQQGFNTRLFSFPVGERSKNRHIKAKLEDQMLSSGCDRDTLILAVGGGVVGDLAGYIAATYMRGIPYIQVPTTLLAMLDSSVGGKTGVDTTLGKNLIGAFWQPKAVISDIQCLYTLSRKQRIHGLIEALKIFLTHDADSVNYFEHNLDSILNIEAPMLIKIIRRAVQLKAEIVTHDERENNQRAVLNFGHTIGHALESLSDYRILHGYAVALGILVEAKIAHLMGLLDIQDYQHIKILLARLNISASALKEFAPDDVIQRTRQDKKKRAGCVRYVLLKETGQVYQSDNQFAHVVPDEVVKQAFFETIED